MGLLVLKSRLEFVAVPLSVTVASYSGPLQLDVLCNLYHPSAGLVFLDREHEAFNYQVSGMEVDYNIPPVRQLYSRVLALVSCNPIYTFFTMNRGARKLRVGLNTRLAYIIDNVNENTTKT